MKKKRNKRPYAPKERPSEAEIDEIDVMWRAERERLRREEVASRGETPADVALYRERRASGLTSKQAVAGLLRSGILRDPVLSYIAHLHIEDVQLDHRDGTPTLDIARHVDLVTRLLSAAGHKEARHKAGWHAFRYWRNARPHPFASGPALLRWIDRNLKEAL